MQQSLDSLREEQVTLHTREDYTQTLRVLARDTEDEREQLAERTAGYDAVEVIQLLEASADAAGVALIIESVGSQEYKLGAGKMQSIVANLRAEGSFQDTYQFLALIETLPIATVVSSASFDKADGDTDAWVAVLRILALTDATNL
jgi:hypothetical protein